MRKEQDLLEGKLRRGIAENAISLLFAQALVQQQEQGCCGFAQGLLWVCTGFAGCTSPSLQFARNST